MNLLKSSRKLIKTGENKPHIPFGYPLIRINEIFKAKDIASFLTTAGDLDDAKVVSEKSHFDRVPINKSSKIETYFDADTSCEKDIKPEDILDSAIGVLDTFSLLSKKDFYFIMEGNILSYFVHYSDLNNPLVSIGLYTQILYCEMEIRDFLRTKVSQELSVGKPGTSDYEMYLKKWLTANQLKKIKEQYQDKKNNNTETDILDELYFKMELKIAKENHLGSSALDKKKIERYNQLRNNIMHANPQIIKQRSDIDEWLTLLSECRYIIGRVDKEKLQLH